MRQAYVNIKKVLSQYGPTMQNVVDEILFVTEMDAAFAAVPKARKAHYPANPVVASTIVQIQRLAFPELMIEIRCGAKVRSNVRCFSRSVRGGTKGSREV